MSTSEERHVSIGVLCIQGAFIEHMKVLEELVKTWERKVTISIHDIRKPSDLLSLDGLIIPGGESTTLSIFLRQNNFEEALKSFAFDEKRPGFVWGTCAGLILLSDEVQGQKKGGQVTIGGLGIQCTRNVYGRQVSSFEGKLKLHDPALCSSNHDPALCSSNHSPNAYTCDEFHGVFIRAPGIAKICSPSVQVLATLKDSNNTVVAVKQGHLMATSFHPELTTDPRWHAYFLNMVLNYKYPLKEVTVD